MTRRAAAAMLILIVPALGQGDLAGTYKGKWAGTSADGDFTLRLEREGEAWKATVRFTLGGMEVPTTVSMLHVDRSTVETKYEFDLGGNKLQSHLQGELKDGLFSGKYQTKSLADDSSVDEGTWEAKRQE